jgi:hypothetical protein
MVLLRAFGLTGGLGHVMPPAAPPKRIIEVRNALPAERLPISKRSDPFFGLARRIFHDGMNNSGGGDFAERTFACLPPNWA